MERLEINPNIHSEINDRIISAKKIIYNLEPADLYEEALVNREGYLSDTGALCVNTGTFTGRSPEDRFIVLDETTKDTVDWGKINKSIAPEKFERLLTKVVDDLTDKTVYVRDAYVCAHPEYRMNVRVLNTVAWHNLFCSNMFMRPTKEETDNFEPNFTIICDPTFEADPEVDGTRQKNFAILNLKERILLVGGTCYSGEMKKGVFSVLNFVLPHVHKVLAMHCSANVGKDGDTAIFFGLSGTGKTTLSTDPDRALIGDDEHGWSEDSVFNFEGGCYAKTIKLTREQEPDIWDAIRFGAIVENTKFHKGTREVDYDDDSITPNTRVSYPIDHIENIQPGSSGPGAKNVFFLAADGFGVLPPISKLNPGQAMYHFISGYTSKVAGTEVGIIEPKLVFSACFGAPFMPLHPSAYAELLGEKMKKTGANVWLINTGWTGGPFGVGSRMKLRHTRAMITAALTGGLDSVKYQEHPVFGFQVPMSCPNVPSEVLWPRDAWADKNDYDQKASYLAEKFIANFEPFAEGCDQSILDGAPKVMAS